MGQYLAQYNWSVFLSIALNSPSMMAAASQGCLPMSQWAQHFLLRHFSHYFKWVNHPSQGSQPSAANVCMPHRLSSNSKFVLFFFLSDFICIQGHVTMTKPVSWGLTDKLTDVWEGKNVGQCMLSVLRTSCGPGPFLGTLSKEKAGFRLPCVA